MLPALHNKATRTRSGLRGFVGFGRRLDAFSAGGCLLPFAGTVALIVVLHLSVINPVRVIPAANLQAAGKRTRHMPAVFHNLWLYALGADHTFRGRWLLRFIGHDSLLSRVLRGQDKSSERTRHGLRYAFEAQLPMSPLLERLRVLSRAEAYSEGWRAGWEARGRSHD